MSASTATTPALLSPLGSCLQPPLAWRAAILSLLLAVFTLFGTAGDAGAGEVVRVGFYDFKPLIFKDKTGEPAGFYVDMVNYVARKEGWQVKYRYGTWKELYQALLDGEVDLVACIGITDARKAQVDFTNQYLFLDWGVIYTRPGSAIQSILDLRGKRVAGMQGSVYTDGLDRTLRQFDITAKMLETKDYEQAFRALQEGRADATVSTNLTGLNFEDQFRVRRTAIIFSPVKLAFAVKKGTHGNLIASLDRTIEAMKTDKNSYYYDRYEFWVNDLKKSRLAPAIWGIGLLLLFGVGVAGTLAWISRREAVQKKHELHESERRFRTLIESMLQGVALCEVIYDADGTVSDYRFLLVNASFERLTGLVGNEVVGRHASEVLPDADAQWLELYREVTQTGNHVHVEEFFKESGKYFETVVYRPRPNQFALIVTDITERKLAEQEIAQKNAELERFTYTVSHDLKSPLITMKSFSGSMKRDLTAGRYDRLVKDLGRIDAAANKMTQLLDGLLDLSRIGRIVNPPESVDMNELVREVVAQLAASLQEKGVELAVQPGLPVVRCDRQRIQEVVQNLVENGIKYLGDQSRPEIVLGVRRTRGKETFFVRDNGIGIDPRYHQDIFGLFNKLDAKSEGNGIGLALVKRIVEAHGEEVWVESEGIGKGSTFCFTMGNMTK